jgi:flagellar basal body rod protein FlgF
MRISNQGINGLAQAQENFDRAANDVNRAATEAVDDGLIQEGDVLELSPAIVAMLSAQRSVETTLKMVHTEDVMARTLLDTLSE